MKILGLGENAGPVPISVNFPGHQALLHADVEGTLSWKKYLSSPPQKATAKQQEFEELSQHS